ncbi:hypothetical protein PIB30_063721 [Stylosanthes scabra]|uniref:PB1-like domain-containing protein n=1 Tax=Stylosanthes scabra TaxID=79078 RepID=A0ABU6UN65_9FABA|nr:hypothetical protein [Stylosanthes scabra]
MLWGIVTDPAPRWAPMFCPKSSEKRSSSKVRARQRLQRGQTPTIKAWNSGGWTCKATPTLKLCPNTLYILLFRFPPNIVGEVEVAEVDKGDEVVAGVVNAFQRCQHLWLTMVGGLSHYPMGPFNAMFWLEPNVIEFDHGLHEIKSDRDINEMCDFTMMQNLREIHLCLDHPVDVPIAPEVVDIGSSSSSDSYESAEDEVYKPPPGYESDDTEED